MVKIAQKRIYHLGGTLSSLLFTLKLSLDLSLLSTYCVVPFAISLTTIPLYTYIKISTECPKIDSLSSKILIFCTTNLSLFLSFFLVTASLKSDDLLSASWYSIFISIYFSILIYFLLVIFLLPGFFRSKMIIQVFSLILWGCCLLISSICLPECLDDGSSNTWKCLMPINIACLVSISGYFYDIFTQGNKFNREGLLYTFLSASSIFATLKLWIALFATCAIYFLADWVLVELENKEKYQEVE